MSTREFRELLNHFCVAIRDCRTVYLEGAKVVIENHPSLLDQSPSIFLETMDELHRGLLVKLYISVCGFDHVFTRHEEMMAQMLILHMWHQEVTGEQVRDSIDQFRRHAETLRWTSLVGPFRKIAPLRPLTPNLETCIMRIGNLMAKADGNVTMLEIEELKSIQREVMTFLTVDAGEVANQTIENRSSSQAVQYSLQEAQRIRETEPAAFRSAAAGSNERIMIGTDAHGNPVFAGEVDCGEVLSVQDEHVESAQTDIEELEIIDDAAIDSGSIKSERERQKAIEAAIHQLQSLNGLASIKEEVRSLTNMLKVQAMRREKGLPETKITLHMVFEGNPGTGKTTVARIVGKIFGAIGILEKGHVIETDRSGLVAEFAGQTGPKANKLIDSALDGILFIDEAYSLIAEGTGGDPFGQEALQTLLKRMEDDRDRLVVIMAGYPDEMDRLLKSNPGLSSRFGRRLTFEDYAPQELGKIFGSMCDENHYQIEGESQAKVILGLNWVHENRDQHFGNGRMVRNVFEQAIRNLSNRVADELAVTEELLTCFHPSDIEFESVPEIVVDDSRLDSARFRIRCTECSVNAKIKTKTLGHRVKCRKCETKFVAKWGALVDSASNQR